MFKRIVYLLPVLLGVALAAAAQNPTPVSSLPYFCGFEDVNENANWTLNRRGGIGASTPLPSQWTISTGAKHSGLNGLYIYSGTQEDAAEYDGTREVFAVAEREFALQPGTYELDFDWRCLGDGSSDAIFVYWVPATTTLTSRTNSTLPTNATPLTINGATNLSGSASWKQVRTTVTVNNMQNYRLVFAWRNNTTNTYNPGGCLDNVQIHRLEQSTDCWHTVTNLRWTQGANADVLSWSSNNPNATFDLYYWLEGDFQIDSIMGVSGTSYQFNHGELSSGVYCFAVRTNCDDGQSILLELLNVKSLGDYTMVAEACPDVSLIADFSLEGEKVLRPKCDEEGQFRVKPNTVAGGGAIAGYRVDQIEYSECPFPFDIDLLPASARNQITTITRDDYWDTQLINLPFAVCFFEGTYRQALVGANGLVTFDPSIRPGSSCSWSLSGQPDIPSTSFVYKNCIMGVYQDYYPVPSAGGRQEIWYGVLGEWPCRKMVVCFNEVPMFANHSTINSSMIVMYEGTNVIDVYVKNRDRSPSGWNDNRGIIGVINADGTDGVAAPGRNTSDCDVNGRTWTAHHEAWRFSPYSTPAFALTWYKGSFQTPADIDAYIRMHPEDPIELTMADSINIAKEDGINAVTVRLQYSQCNGDYIDIIDHARILWPQTDTVVVDTFTCAGRPYNDRYVNRADTAGTYETVIPDSYGCDSVFYRLNLRLLQKETATLDTVICPGQVLDYKGLRVSEAGEWPVTIKYSNCDCDSVTETINLSVLDKLSAGIADFPDRICADDSVLSFLLEASVPGLHYNVHFEPEGAGFEDITDAEIDQVAEVLVHMSKNVYPAVYKMYIEVVDEACGSAFDSVQFVVNYPASIAPQKWGNVLVLLNEEANGGYVFTGIQWYKNGQPIGDPNQPSLYLGEGERFSPNDEYTVGLIRAGETMEIISCPLGDLATGFEQIEVVNGLPQTFDGMMTIYDVMGRIVMRSAYSYDALMQWMHSHNASTMYLVRLSSQQTEHTYRFFTR